ncbi:MAG: hypothetical protein ACR2G4_15335 [Pyrinomonadaceae bacterium]
MLRTLRRFVLPTMLISVCLLPALTTFAQERTAQTPIDPRREQALVALENILSEAKGYEDRILQVRVKAQIADVLWSLEPERARELLVAAFQEVAELKADLADRYIVRAEVAAIARRHDPELASRLIAKLAEAAGGEERLSRDSLERISERGALSLDSARDFLGNGEQARALAFARRSLAEGRSAQLLWFLSELRERDGAAADRLFLDAVGALRQAPADPNDVLLLGLYLFYPGSVAVGTLSDGVEAVGYGVNFSLAPPVSPALAQAYLQAAADALLRFPVTPGLPGAAGSIALKRFALTQLLPLFQLYEPRRLAAVGATLAGLGQPTTPPRVTADAKPSVDGNAPVSDVIKSIEQLPEARQRDHYFFTTLRSATNEGSFERARALAARIKEDDLRHMSLEFIGFNEARAHIKRGDLETAAKLAASTLTRERRTAINFQLAKAWLERGDLARAGEEANAAVAEAAKLANRAQRARIYIYLAAGLAEWDAARAFELLEAAGTDINDTEHFDALDDRLTFRIQTPAPASFTFDISSGVGLLPIISQLAKTDFNRVLTMAQALREPAPRALSIIAACRAVINLNDQRPHKKRVMPTPARQ